MKASRPVIINPRGFRAYVQNEAFFRAIPLVLQKLTRRRASSARLWQMKPRRSAGLTSWASPAASTCCRRQTRPQMADLFRRARVAVSPTTHDGTPNTLLEAMACGCFPVAGDLEPLREWITPGENGLLVDPTQPQALAQAIIAALDDPALCARARLANLALIAARADYAKSMASAEEFYQEPGNPLLTLSLTWINNGAPEMAFLGLSCGAAAR